MTGLSTNLNLNILNYLEVAFVYFKFLMIKNINLFLTFVYFSSLINLFCIRILLFRRVVTVNFMNDFFLILLWCWELFVVIVDIFGFSKIWIKLSKHLKVLSNIIKIIVLNIFFWFNDLNRWCLKLVYIILTLITLLKPPIIFFYMSKPNWEDISKNDSKDRQYSNNDCTPSNFHNITNHINTKHIISKLQAINNIPTISWHHQSINGIGNNIIKTRCWWLEPQYLILEQCNIIIEY